MSRLHNKVAVITGGNSGIGLATAKRYVEEGAYVFIFGRRQEELDKAVAEIGSNVTAVRGDVTNLDDIDRLYAEVARIKGKFDVLVAAAGVVVLEPIGKVTEANFDKMFNLNTRGLLFLVQKGLPVMRDNGSIILFSSVAAFMGLPAYSAYGATKAAVRSYARTWTMELKGRGIRTNVISPGPIETPMIDSQGTPEEVAKLREIFSANVPLGRMGRPEEVANVALFLGSDESSYVAGAEFSVDGGMGAV